MLGHRPWNCRISGSFVMLWVAGVVLAAAGTTTAEPPASQRLLPATTTGYVSVPDVYKMEDSWNRTQLGQLLADPVMNGFGEDLKRQLKEKFTRMRTRLGLTLDDLEDVPGGEVAAAMIRPAEGEAVVAVLVDITGHEKQADELLKTIHKNLTDEKATKAEKEIRGTTVTIYTLPPREGEEQERQAVFFIKDKLLCGSDNLEVARSILGRFAGEPKDNLENLAAYRAVMGRCEKEAGTLAPQLRWFVEPFGYIECARTIQVPQRHKKGKDMVKILASEGFDALQGAGGFLNFMADEKYEILHRSMVYAPGVDKPNTEGDKYNLAMRMLRFPNGGDLAPPDWMLDELATYMSFNWDLQNAFNTMDTLADAVIGDKGAWADVIDGFKTDPYGPKVDVQSELIAHLGSRVTVVSDYVLPITPKSERLVFGIAVNDVPALEKTIDRIMENDPNAERREVNGHVVWEIVEEEEELPEIDIAGGPGFAPLGTGPEEDDKKDKDKERQFPNAAVCVAHGQLLIASHMEFMKKVLTDVDERNRLVESVDYQLVADDLEAVAGSTISFRFFSRTEEEFRPTYELIRQGRMPEAESLFGKLLNRLLTEEGEEDILREQLIDGSKLPEFEMVRRYFGPAGATVRSEEDGWFVSGFALNKEARATPLAQSPTAQQAQKQTAQQ